MKDDTMEVVHVAWGVDAQHWTVKEKKAYINKLMEELIKQEEETGLVAYKFNDDKTPSDSQRFDPNSFDVV